MICTALALRDEGNDGVVVGHRPEEGGELMLSSASFAKGTTLFGP